MRDAAAARAQAALLDAVRRPADALPPDIDPATLVGVATERRILLLAGWLLRRAGTLPRWPDAFREAFDSGEREAIAVDCVREAELTRVLTRLETGGIRTLLLKGAALAWSHYPAPHLRVRSDTDILVPAADAQAAGRVLETLGYERPPEVSGALVSFQAHYHRDDVADVVHAWDVHWKISNVQSLADALSFDELWDRRRAVGVGISAVAPCAVHAALIALVHRAGHHPGSRDPLWMWDLHLLLSGLADEGIREIQAIAVERGLATLVSDGLTIADDMFEAPAARRIVDGLKGAAATGESPTVREGQPFSQIDLLRLDLRALPGWRTRATLLCEHLFPPAAYMTARYGARTWNLPACYVWRIARGVPKWLRRRDALSW